MRIDRRESGSIVIVVTVLLVLGGLAAAVLARTSSSMTSSRRGQDFSAALAQADAGVSDALFRLDQFGDTLPPQFCVGSSPSCTGAVTAASDVEYVVTPVSGKSNEVVIRSRGRSNKVPHGVEAYARSDQRYPYAIFAKTSITFNGNSGGTIQSAPGAPPAYVGSGGSITCNGTGSPGAGHVAEGSNNCPNQPEAEQDYDPQDPVLDCADASPNVPATPCASDDLVNDPPLACPGTFTTYKKGSVDVPTWLLDSIVEPGVYHCDGNIKFPEPALVVNTVGSHSSRNGGIVEIFVIAPSGGPSDIEMERSKVNEGGSSNKFRVYKAGSGVIDVGGGNNSESFTGIMYAPSATLTENGCNMAWRGSIVVNQATCNGGPNQKFTFTADAAGLLVGNWRIRHFREIPSASVVLP